MGNPGYRARIGDVLTFNLGFLLSYNHMPRAGALSSLLPWGSVLENLGLCVEPMTDGLMDELLAITRSSQPRSLGQ